MKRFLILFLVLFLPNAVMALSINDIKDAPKKIIREVKKAPKVVKEAPKKIVREAGKGVQGVKKWGDKEVIPAITGERPPHIYPGISITHNGQGIRLDPNSAYINIGGVTVKTHQLARRLEQIGCVVGTGGNVLGCAPDVVMREAGNLARISITHNGRGIRLDPNSAYMNIGGVTVKTHQLARRLEQVGCVVETGGDVLGCAPDVVEREARNLARISITHNGQGIRLDPNSAYINIGGVTVKTRQLAKRLDQVGCVVETEGNVLGCAPDVVEREAWNLAQQLPMDVTVHSPPAYKAKAERGRGGAS
uniref:Uncharacterized protein n=1 Tax=Candidatus Kentrum sp. DK TaxID=2126562 RepID=A0A450T2B8_9GAMM|nr:MAG: hypothetical protein BECKDK2373B_GA0170837_10942 [Candidatus Kentron sp. DK]